MTGGGHYAPAKAIANTIKGIRGTDIEIVLHDGLKGAKPYLRSIIEDGYKYSVNKALWSFEMLYAINKVKPVSQMTVNFVTELIKPGIRDVILKERPHKIVVFHFLLIKPVAEILREYSLKLPVVVVVTDPFTAPVGWFLDNNQKFIVFSDILKEKCLRMGIDSSNIQVFPFVLDPKFSTSSDNLMKLEVRKKLGFREDSRIILMIGGGDGMPRGKRIFRNIISSGIDAEIAVVCGRDKNLYDQLNGMKEKYNLNNTRIYGFIDFVHSLIQISDVVITKAGPSTCMEILLAGKVPVITSFIWEQEKGNKEFICKNGMGVFKKDPGQIPGIVNKLLKDDNFYRSLTNNIRNNRIKNGVGQVSDYLMNFN
jgi:processive 1,2-diacylglycerol beta-glucosyltransferase/1,2-diacylglycerol 3-beta-galactosyltransferase